MRTTAGALSFSIALLAAAALTACSNRESGPPAAAPSPSPAINIPPTFGPADRGDLQRTLSHGGRTRTYLLHVPQSYNGQPMPLVLVLHGGGGEGDSMPAFTGFSRLADREGFLVAYPQGVEGSWNDGRDDTDIAAQRLKIDDVGFLRAVVDGIATTHTVDPARIYATGISNGGFMSFRLACEASDRFAAVGVIVANLGENVSKSCRPARPVPVIMMNGTEDPLVPYAGGAVRIGAQERGRILSVDDTVASWARANGCTRELLSEEPDRDPRDGVTTSKRLETGCTAGADVLAYRMNGAGHIWPGAPQYRPVAVIGRTTQDFDGAEAAWAFFKAHPKSP